MPPRSSKKKSQRDRLLGRTRPTLTHHLRVDDDTAARAAVEAAREQLAAAEMRFDPRAGEAVKEARAALEAAQGLLAECYEPVVLRAMPPKEFEELVAQHPARKDETERWNNDTFPRAAFLASVTGELSRTEWETVLDEQLSEGERNAICLDALRVNARMPDGTIPKD